MLFVTFLDRIHYFFKWLPLSTAAIGSSIVRILEYYCEMVGCRLSLLLAVVDGWIPPRFSVLALPVRTYKYSVELLLLIYDIFASFSLRWVLNIVNLKCPLFKLPRLFQEVLLRTLIMEKQHMLSLVLARTLHSIDTAKYSTTTRYYYDCTRY